MTGSCYREAGSRSHTHTHTPGRTGRVARLLPQADQLLLDQTGQLDLSKEHLWSEAELRLTLLSFRWKLKLFLEN